MNFHKNINYLGKLEAYLNRSNHEQYEKSGFDRNVDAGEGDCTIDGCKSALTMIRTVQIRRSKTRRSLHRKRNGKIETMNSIHGIQTNGDQRRRCGKLRLAVTKNNRRKSHNAFDFCWRFQMKFRYLEEIENHTHRLAPYG